MEYGGRNTANGIRRTENGGRKRENGKRRTEKGERKTENGKGRTENGKGRTENGKGRTENGGREMRNAEFYSAKTYIFLYLLQIAPNPTREQINIHYQMPPTGRSAHIRIFDIMGREVQREKVSINDDTFISKVLLSGVYFVVLEVDGVFVREGKVVVLGN